MTFPTPLDAPEVHPLHSYPLHSHQLQSNQHLYNRGGYDPALWHRLRRIVGFEDVNYKRGLRDALFLLAPTNALGTPVHSTPERTARDRAFWWLATGGYLLDGVLPTRDAVRVLVMQLASERWHQDALNDTLDDVDQLLAMMRKADRSSLKAVPPDELALAESSS